MASVLYISYDGLMEPLGQSQVLRYLEGLSLNHKIWIISFEKEGDLSDYDKLKSLKINLAKRKINWIYLKYHKSPTSIATLFDILSGIIVGLWLVLRHDIKIVHARSYVASVVALTLKKLTSVSYIFDMRGFWPDERVDGGLWLKEGYLYRISKWFERIFLTNADEVISLTHAAVDTMRNFPYLKECMPNFKVITTCTDLDLFKPNSYIMNRKRPLTLGYVGSVGTWYLFNETLSCYKIIKDIIPDAQLHIINRGEHDYIIECLNNMEIDLTSVVIKTEDHIRVARAMELIDIGIFMIKPMYSKIASAPTKLGEFLGCGIPCLCNYGVGDMGQLVESERVGIALNGFDDEEKIKSIRRLLSLINEPDINKRCRNTALKYFSLVRGVESYNKIYHSLEG